MPLTFSNFSRARQAHFLSYDLQIWWKVITFKGTYVIWFWFWYLSRYGIWKNVKSCTLHLTELFGLSNYLINVSNRPPLNKYLDLWGSIWIFKGLFGPLIVKLHMLRVYLAKSVLLYNDEGLFGFNEGLFGTRVYLVKTLWGFKRYFNSTTYITNFQKKT